MPLQTQFKMISSLRTLLAGGGRNVLPGGNEAKPPFPAEWWGEVMLPRCAPEAQGLESRLLEGFFRQIAAEPDCYAHALMVLRHGHVVAEGYFAPYRREVWQVVHSMAKSFTGTAVGMAIAEGLFTEEDAVASFFPDKVPRFAPRRLHRVQVKHLLNMTSGISFNEVDEAFETDWVKGTFGSPISSEPGSKFVYNSINSYLLSAIVGKTSGQTLFDYLDQRLFTPMGFGPIGWERCPMNTEKGGWGLYTTLENMAKLGQLYLQNGLWETGGKTRRLLPAAWVAAATKTQARGENGEEYGYQIWTDSENKVFIMNGMFGQYVVGIPALDMVIALQSGSSKLFADAPAYNIMQQNFFGLTPAAGPLPPAPAACGRLARSLSALRFRRPLAGETLPARQIMPGQNRRRAPWGKAPPPQRAGADAFCGRTWFFEPGRTGLLPIIVQAMDNNFSPGLSSLRLEKTAAGFVMHWREGGAPQRIPVGLKSAQQGKFRAGKEEFLLACSAEVRQNEDLEEVLVVEVCFLEHSSYRLLKLLRQGDRLLLWLDESPQLGRLLEASMEKENDRNAGGAGAMGAFGDLVYNNDYIHFKVNQLCTPELVGSLAAPEEKIK